MSSIPKNLSVINEASYPLSLPNNGERCIYATSDGWYDVDSDGNVKKLLNEDDVSADVDLSNYYTKDETQELVESKISSVYKYCGSVETIDSLPNQKLGENAGNTYNVITGTESETSKTFDCLLTGYTTDFSLSEYNDLRITDSSNKNISHLFLPGTILTCSIDGFNHSITLEEFNGDVWTVTFYGDVGWEGFTITQYESPIDCDNGDNVVWTGYAWDNLGNKIDLSNYYTKDESVSELQKKENVANKITAENENPKTAQYYSAKAIEAYINGMVMDKQNIFGCVWNKEKRCNFDTNAKTVNIPQYSRIVYSDTVITDTGTSAWGGVTVDLSDVQHGFIVFNKSTKTYAAQTYTDTTFSADEIVLFAYGDYSADYLAGLSDVTVNGVTRILDYSVTTDKVADGAITTKKLAPYAVDSTISTVAGRNALFFNATKYCNFDTVNKKLTIPSYSRVMCGRTVYVGGVLNETVTLDLSVAQNGYITYNNADNKWTVYTYSTVRVDSENELIMFVYSNYGKIVSSPSAYTVDGKLFGVDTDLVIPDGYIEQNMLAPKLMQNQLSRCPKYTYTDLSEIGFSAWSDISIIGDKLWLFYPSGDENHTQMNGTIKIVNKETLEVVKTITHNFGHMNTCDYCKETNCLIVGNLPGNTTYPAALYVFYNVSDWENVDTLDFATVDKTIVDMRSAFTDTATAACSWGETNFAYNNVVYVSLGFNKKFAKIILGMGTNQLTYGTYISTTNNKFNGTYNVLVDSDFVPMASTDEVTQGATFYNGQMLTANGDDRTARASLWQFDINGNIQRELMEFPIYNADGQKNSQYKTYTEGIAYDEETGYIYQGIFSGQVHTYRFYLIKYKL